MRYILKIKEGLFDLSSDYASYGAQALMNLWDSQGEEILSRFPMLSEYGGEETQRAIWTGEAHTTKEGLYISKKERPWFLGNTYNLKDNKEIIDKMKQTPKDEKTLPTVPKMKKNE